MYKKIQHNIVEEHFDNIAAYQCGGNANVAMTARHIGANNLFSPIIIENTPAAVAFREASRDFSTRYVTYLRSYLVAKLGGNIEEAASIKQMFEKFYPTELAKIYSSMLSVDEGDRVSRQFKILSDGVISLIDAVSEGKDINEALTTIRKQYEDYSSILNSLLPDWDKNLLNDLFRDYVNTFVDQITSRNKKDWSSDQTALARTYELMVSGTPRNASFADIISKGFIQRNTPRFATMY
jgi:hypothetical protein